MSEYIYTYETLDPIARVRCTEMLQLVGLEDEPHKLWNTEQLEDDMMKWPPVECGHIFCYCINRLRIFYKATVVAMEKFGSP